MNNRMRSALMIFFASATVATLAGCQMERQTTGSIWPTNCAAPGSTCETPDRSVPNN